MFCLVASLHRLKLVNIFKVPNQVLACWATYSKYVLISSKISTKLKKTRASWLVEVCGLVIGSTT
jgi:hypothetical protein